VSFAFYERLSLHLTIAIGILLIAATGEILPPYWLIAGACLILGTVYLSSRHRALLTSATLPTILVVVFSFFDIFYWSANYLVAATDLVLLLLALKLLGDRRVVDNLQMLGLSFLLVLGASVVTVDAVYGLLLLIYVFAGLWAMLLQNLRGHWESAGGDSDSLGRRRGMLGGAFGAAVLVLGVGILVFTLAIYFAFPRIGMRFWRSPGGYSQSVSGFSDVVRLNDVGNIQTNPALALRVTYGRGQVPPEESPRRRLRGIVLDRFDGLAWSDSRPIAVRNATQFDGNRWQLDRQGPVSWTATVTPEPDYAGVLFVPSGVAWVEGRFDAVRKLQSGNFSIDRPPRGKLAYTVAMAGPADARRPIPTDLELPPRLSPRVTALAAEWSKGKAGKAVAEAISRRLMTGYQYSTALAQTESDSPLEEFLFRRKSGHCELFASSLAILLRTQGIPTHIINGFAGGENWGDDAVVFRELHAHSWVEAYFDGEGWVQFDPTPAVVVALPWMTEITKVYYTAIGRLKIFWGEWFVDFDNERQVQVASHLKQASNDVAKALNTLKLPRGASFGKYRKGTFGTVLVCVIVAALLGYRRIRSKAVSRLALSKMYASRLRMAEKVLVRAAGETPFAFATKLVARDQRWADFERYTRLYYKLRYGPDDSKDGLQFLDLHDRLSREKIKF
jgi:transglutaminase-like putative cysteine protease